MEVLSDTVANYNGSLELMELFEYLSDICSVSAKPVVLMIDEVDSAANNQVFLVMITRT